MSTYDPDNWLLSLHRALTDLVKSKINAAIPDDLNNDAGLEAFEIIMDWPEADKIAHYVKLPKTVVHFATDDIDNRLIGIGDNLVAAVENTAGDPDTITWQEGQCHIVNFDVGVWASDESGGVTSRLFIYQLLQQLFNTELGKRAARVEMDGVEIVRFNGGRFITDRASDVRVYRIIDAELVVRVYSRAVDTPVAIVDMEPVQEPDVEIDGLPVT